MTLLNLLISIVGNSFDEVVENSIASDCQERCSLIKEVEELHNYYHDLRKKFLKVAKQVELPKYLHVCQYIRNKELENGNLQFEGKIRVMKD